MGFRVLWGFDALLAAVVLGFFVIGLADGSVSSFNLGIWLVLLLVVGGVMAGSLRLRSAGYGRAAAGLLLVLAVPGLAYLLFFLVVLIAQPRWN